MRHTKNATTKTTKRTVVSKAFDAFPPADTSVEGENNTNLVNFDDGAGVAWYYQGYDYIPFESSQAGTQAP
jgi:hypothetical protein